MENALKSLFSRFGTYMGLGLLIYLPLLLLMLWAGEPELPEEDLTFGDAMGAILFLSIPHAFTAAACSIGICAEAQGWRRHMGDLARRGARVFFPYYFATALITLASMFGLVLLIIPGLFVMALFTFIGPAIAIERSGFFAGIDRTLELARGSLLRLVFLAIIYLLIAFVILSPQAFTGDAGDPISSVGIYLTYAALSVFGGLLGGAAYGEMLRARGEQLPASLSQF